MDSLVELSCGACSWHALVGPEGIERHLRAAGMLKRDRPDRATLDELLHGAAPTLKCPDCGTPGLRVRPQVDNEDWDDDWQDAVSCDICRKPIPPERLEAAPGATRCVTCQQAAESGRLADEPEYCARCGALLVLRVSSGADTTRYKLFCTGIPPCKNPRS